MITTLRLLRAREGPITSLKNAYNDISFDKYVGKDAFVQTMVNIVLQGGWEPYAYQAGRAERELCESGYLKHHWGGDIPRGDQICDVLDVQKHCMILCDTDYYLDDFHEIAFGQPILIHTLRVTSPVHQDPYRSWHFSEDVMHSVVGQNRFEHKIWDFPGRSGQIVRIGQYAYKVHVRAIPDTYYQVVFLEPVFKKSTMSEVLRDSLHLCCCPSTVYRRHKRDGVMAMNSNFRDPVTVCNALGKFLKGRSHVVRSNPTVLPLERLKINTRGERKEWSTLKVNEGGTTQLLFAVAGSYDINTVEYSHYKEIESRKKLVRPEVKMQYDFSSNRLLDNVLEMINDTSGLSAAERVKLLDSNTSPLVVVYTYGSEGYLASEKVKGGCYPLAAPFLVDPKDVPLSTRANETAGINSRVLDIQSSSKQFIRPFVRLCLNEFVANAKPLIEGRVWTEQEVLEHQDTPSKRQSLTRAIMSKEFSDSAIMSEREWEAYVANDDEVRLLLEATQKGFIKPEPAASDPRMITPLEGPDKLYMQYVYAFKEAMSKPQKFFAFGLSPEETEERLRGVASTAVDGTMYETDFSRMDGRKGIVGRTLFSMLLQAAFNKSDGLKALQFHRNTVGMKIKSRNGVKYTNGFSLGSGSPDTTDNNSWETAFILYYAQRKSGKGNTDAWEWLTNCALISGDDSIVTGLDRDAFKHACKHCGHVEKLVVRKNVPWCFLGRLCAPAREYARIPNSCQDPSRVCDKLTLSAEKLLPGVQSRKRLHEKACAILTTDCNSPFVSIYAKLVITAGLEQYGWARQDVFNWLNYNVNPGHYANETAMWMEEAFVAAHPTVDFKAFLNWAEDVRAATKGNTKAFGLTLFDLIERIPQFKKPDKKHSDKVAKATKYAVTKPGHQVEIIEFGEDVPEEETGVKPEPRNNYRKALSASVKEQNALKSLPATRPPKEGSEERANKTKSKEQERSKNRQLKAVVDKKHVEGVARKTRKDAPVRNKDKVKATGGTQGKSSQDQSAPAEGKPEKLSRSERKKARKSLQAKIPIAAPVVLRTTPDGITPSTLVQHHPKLKHASGRGSPVNLFGALSTEIEPKSDSLKPRTTAFRKLKHASEPNNTGAPSSEVEPKSDLPKQRTTRAKTRHRLHSSGGKPPSRGQGVAERQ